MKRYIAGWLERHRAAAGEAPLCVLPQALPLDEARRVLVLAPHPDDECIGCGGLIARLVGLGVVVRVVLVTDGSGAGGLPAGADRLRQHEFLAALGRLGVAEHKMLGFPDGGLRPDAGLFDAVAREFDSFAPNWVLCPCSADAHRDHRCVAQAARRAARRCPAVQALLEYETWGLLPATHVLDIGTVMEAKMAALSEHVTALQQMDYAGATRGLARYRGLLVTPGRPAAVAEAFVLTRRDTGFAWPPGLGRPEA
jgi:LmbE family N-acetylglucosaminyl deacetylase